MEFSLSAASPSQYSRGHYFCRISGTGLFRHTIAHEQSAITGGISSPVSGAQPGPFIVTADEVKDPHNIQVKLWVNGVLKQNYNTSDMAHKIPRSIEWMSQLHDLEPGDILATGTNHRGLSAFQDGDTVDLECEGMGKLTIKVRDDLKRTWARETRLEREQKGLKGTTPQLTGKYAKA